MPLVLAFLGGLLSFVPALVGRVLLALGMGYATFTGFDLALDWVMESIKTNMSAMPADVMNFMAFMWVDRAIALIFSSVTMTLTLKLTAGKLTKLVVKAPGA
jgi:hypothetical protein